MLTLRTMALVACVTCLWPSVHSEDQYVLPEPKQNVASEENSTEKVPDLQIGCEEGYSTETSEKRDSEEKARKARSYFYRIETPSSLISVWKPPYYRLHRPYYVPVYGAEGQVPFYFPPQPIFINAGFPLDNPPFRGVRPGQGYLPPEVDVTTEDTIGNRFEDDRPVWDRSPARPSTPRPSAPRPNAPPPSPPQVPQIVPTRRPKPARTTTVPPLIHSVAPPPPFVGELSGRNDLIGESTQTTPSPSQCVWAIISCCAPGSKTVNTSCFERYTCPGPFWDRSPCESDFAKLAIQSALGYYDSK